MNNPRTDLRDDVDRVRPEDGSRVVEVWEASVRATHHFLSEADIQSLKPLVLHELLRLPHLLCVRSTAGELVGFVGIAGAKMEALFVHPSWHGLGVGRRLVRHAVVELNVSAVDVNEQNEQAVGFYLRLGFEVGARSPVDSAGRPFPLLHLLLPVKASEALTRRGPKR